MAVDFWDSATEGFNKGVALGVRNTERAEERKYRDRAETRRDEEAKRQQESHNLQMRLGAKTEKATGIELQEKEEQQRQKNFKRSYVIAKALADSGDERPAWSLVSESYNKLVNNGDEMMVFHKDDKGDLEFPGGKKWDDYPGAKHLIVTRKYGAVPVKNISDALKIIEPFTDPEKFMEYERQQKSAVESLNASEKPFRGKDGKLYKKEWSLTRTGKKSKDVPYEGVEHMSVEEQKVRNIKDIPAELLNEEGKRVLLGVSKAESPSERIAAKKALNDSGVKAMKDWMDLTGKQRDQYKKDLELVLKPFSVGGKPVLDFETGEMTSTGENALKSAGKLIDKAEKDSSSLTTEEKRNLPHARRAQQMYEKISGAVSSDYVKPAKGNWKQFDTAPGYGNRTDGTKKGKGFLGELKRRDGKVSTELSIGVTFDGKETEIPTLVPTLSKDEINYLLEGGEPTKAIIRKAVDHAKKRIASGKSPFAEEGEQPSTTRDY
ncbi:MAG: hypothetical protein A4E71_00097 [Smithella sp. PtaU1.Bin162]|nr:MAG: hypothetical protein A4E71_00097 [Smithella sp. PtaU1.Bin162]